MPREQLIAGLAPMHMRPERIWVRPDLGVDRVDLATPVDDVEWRRQGTLCRLAQSKPCSSR